MQRIGAWVAALALLGTVAGCSRRGDQPAAGGSAVAASTSTPSAGREAQVKFRARVGDLMLPADPLTAGKGPDDTVAVTFPTTVYEPPRTITPIAREETSLANPEEAVVANFSAFKADDHDWIRTLFAAGDQEDLEAMLADKAMTDRQAELFAAIQHEQLRALIHIPGDTAYVLALVSNDDEPATSARSLTFVEEDGVWKRTNALGGDARLGIVWNAFRHGEVGGPK